MFVIPVSIAASLWCLLKTSSIGLVQILVNTSEPGLLWYIRGAGSAKVHARVDLWLIPHRREYSNPRYLFILTILLFCFESVSISLLHNTFDLEAYTMECLMQNKMNFPEFMKRFCVLFPSLLALDRCFDYTSTHWLVGLDDEILVSLSWS